MNALDFGVADLLENFLCIFDLVELNKCEVELLEERSIQSVISY